MGDRDTQANIPARFHTDSKEDQKEALVAQQDKNPQPVGKIYSGDNCLQFFFSFLLFSDFSYLWQV